jgi:hypothetical protein
MDNAQETLLQVNIHVSIILVTVFVFQTANSSP